MLPAIASRIALVSIASLAAAVGAPAMLMQGSLQASPPNANPDYQPSRLETGVERVIVFKDGYGLFVKRASAVADADGRVYTFEVPDAVLGAFWAQAEGREVMAMRAEWVDSLEPKTEESSCLTTLEVLRANPGKQVTLATEKGEVVGKLAQVLEAPAAPVHAPESGQVTVELTPRGGELVAIDTPKGRLVMPVAQVRSVLGPDLTVGCKRTAVVAQKKKRLSFDLGKAAAGAQVKLRLFYFVPGIRWIPTYRLQTGDGGKAELALQGELLNEVEDLRAAAVDLVVGVPNFRFKELISPLSLERTLRNALLVAAPSLMGNDNNRFSNAMFSQRAGERVARVGGEEGDEIASGGGVMGLAPELAAEKRQDLFAYNAKGVTLPKGARATLPLWRLPVSQRHLYTLDLAIQRSGTSYSYAQSGNEYSPSPLRLQKNSVWHQLELTNPSSQPWTTGAALVLQDQLPIGQDLLTYTPVGGHSLLPLTVAVDVQSAHNEEVVERRPNALTVDGHSYTLVRKKGTIVLRNFRTERSPLVVTLSTGGKVDAVEGKVAAGDSQASDGVAQGVNGHANVTWELTLDAKATRTLTYQVAVYE
jgi:hypothetical protein